MISTRFEVISGLFGYRFGYKPWVQFAGLFVDFGVLESLAGAVAQMDRALVS